jgi:hypothetical protein
MREYGAEEVTRQMYATNTLDQDFRIACTEQTKMKLATIRRN